MTDINENALFADNTEKEPVSSSQDNTEITEDSAVNGMPEYHNTDALEDGSISEPDGNADEADEKSEAEKTVETLKEEIEQLRAQIKQLEDLKRSQNRILSELGDFTALFPEIPVEEIPDEVWESVKNGAPLAASYALYEKRMAAEALRIARINAKNASRSPGAAGTDTAGEYFSPDDVRRMSRAEVHANYSKIKESMKKWMQR